MIELPEVAIPASQETSRAPEGQIKHPTIRAHHLIFAGWAMGLGELGEKTPEAFARTFTRRVVDRWLNSIFPVARTYAETTVRAGGKDTSKQYEEALGSGLRRFIDADPEEEFTIVEEIPDTIVCAEMKKCALADHCTRRLGEFAEGKFADMNEFRQMDEFLAALKVLGISYEIRPAMSASTDMKQELVRTVTLKAGQIRNVIRFMADSEQFKHNFVDPFRSYDVQRNSASYNSGQTLQ